MTNAQDKPSTAEPATEARPTNADRSGTHRREDLTANPEELAARFLSDAVQADPSEDAEERAKDDDEALPIGEPEQREEQSRADRSPVDTDEGNPR